MTRERSEEVVLVALVLSVAIHIGLMILVRPQVMTHPLSAAVKASRHGPTRIVRAPERPDPVQMAELEDLTAAKDAPAAVGEKAAPLAAAPAAAVPDVGMPDPSAPSASALPQVPAPVMDARPAGRDASPSVRPMTRIETPGAGGASADAPTFSVKLPDLVKAAVPVAPPPARAPSAALPPAKLVRTDGGDPAKSFTPAREVYEKVDEKVVAAEKAAVRELVNAERAEPLEKSVNVAMASTVEGGWRYFRVMMTPRTSLQVVPKDVVMVIDGSGSIGNDRLANCRKAARQILRTCTNTGDRFNLVVFRNAFSYAFRSWRDCDAASFEAGDKWLAKQTAHGRTDVFSTIRSVLTLPRDPKRPLVAMVVTDGDANAGVSDTAEILSRFTALNDGLVSVYMYGVKSSANRELIDVLTHGNRGESFIFDGWRWNSGDGMEELSERFRDPVLSDLRIIYSSGSEAESYPRLLRNLYRGGTLTFVGRVPAAAKAVSFSLRGINGATAHESFFTLPFATASEDPKIAAAWLAERAIDRKCAVRP